MTFKYMGGHGHLTTTYDVLDEAQAVAAKAAFENIIGAGKTVFAVPAGAKTGEQTTHFDPSVSEYLVMSPMAGGMR